MHVHTFRSWISILVYIVNIYGPMDLVPFLIYVFIDLMGLYKPFGTKYMYKTLVLTLESVRVLAGPNFFET